MFFFRSKVVIKVDVIDRQQLPIPLCLLMSRISGSPTHRFGIISFSPPPSMSRLSTLFNLLRLLTTTAMTLAKNGICTTQAVYSQLSHQQVHQLPTQGPRSVTEDASNILHKVWKSKLIPSILKTFAWTLIRRALATGERVGRYSVHIDKHCDYCGDIKTDQHLFFKCNLPTQIWYATNPPLLTNNIPPEEDGVQMSLSLRLSII